MALRNSCDELICMFKESAEIMTNRSATLHVRSYERPICLCESTLVFFLVVTRPRTFVRVARIAVRGWRVLIFRGCDHLSDTATAVERHSLPPGGYGPRDNAISLDYLRHVYAL